MRPFFYVLSLLLISTFVHANPDIETEVRQILSDRDIGRNNLLGLLGFILAAVSFVGVLVYRQVKNSISALTRDKILENESRSLIRLGVRDFEGYHDYQHMNDHDSMNGVALSSLLSAITHTRQAWYNATRVSGESTAKPKNNLLALSGANQAYFFTCLMRHTPDAEQELKARYRSKALEAINNANLHISICCKAKEISGGHWWDMAESELYTFYYCNKDFDDENSARWRQDKKNIQKRLQDLVDDYDIPQNAREEIRKDWAFLLSEDLTES